MSKLQQAPAPRSPSGWIEICERELKNLRAAYYGQLTNDVKIDHAIRAIEASLKAIIWRHEEWTEWPRRGQKETDFLYRHNLDTLLDRCGLRTRLQLSPPHNASWKVIVNACVKQHKYSNVTPSDTETNEVAKCARFPDTGVVPWLLNYYRNMK